MRGLSVSKSSAGFSPGSLGLFLQLAAIGGLVAASLVFSQTLINFPGPPGAALGFSHAWWVSSINRMILPPINLPDNAVHAFDPVTSTWTDLYTVDQNNFGSGAAGHPGVLGRDNFTSFYIPKLDQMWITSGSHMDNQGIPDSLMFVTGVFSFSGCAPDASIDCGRWVTRNTIWGDGAGLIKNMNFYGPDPACAWSATANTGMVGWAFLGLNDGQTCTLVEPNTSGIGPEPYIARYIDVSNIPWRKQNMNSLVAVGDDFYLYGGSWQDGITFEYHARIDLWKYTLATHSWTQLQDSPPRSYLMSTLTYDSDLNALVVWADDKIFVYDIKAAQWSDRTPPNLPFVANHVGVYAPNVKMHIYSGGCYYSSSGEQLSGTYATWGLSLNPVVDSIAPSKPENLKAGVVSLSQINLSWDASTDNVGVAYYKIYRNDSLIGTSATASYSDKSITAIASYSYQVSACDPKGNESAKSLAALASTDKPMFPVDRIDTVLAGNRYECKILYSNPKGDPVSIDVLQKPAWCTLVGVDSVYGFAPDSSQINTLLATLTVNKTVLDTLVVRILVKMPSQALFLLSQDFSTTQGTKGATYQYGNNDSYSNMSYDGANNSWKGNEQYLLIGNGWFHPGANSDAVLKWTADRDINIRLTGNVKKSDIRAGDGVLVSIRSNGSTEWGPQTIAFNDSIGKFYDNLSLSLKAGESICFIVNRNGNNDCDGTMWDVAVYEEQVVRALPINRYGPTRELTFSASPRAGKGIEFAVGLPQQGEFDLQVFNVAGKKIWSLHEGISNAGYYRVSWNLNSFNSVGNGLYVATLKQGTSEKKIKFTLLK